MARGKRYGLLVVRTTEEASAIHVLVLGLDGKSKTVFEVRPPQAAFFDLANTLDHCRNSGLEATTPPSPYSKGPESPLPEVKKPRRKVAAA